MESDNLDIGENPPASSSIVQENDEFSFTNRSNDASHSAGIFHYSSSARVDPLPLLYMPSPIAPFPLQHMHGTYQPSTHTVPDTHDDLMFDLNLFHNLQNPRVDLNSINIRTGMPTPYRRDLPFPEGNAKQVSYTSDKGVGADTSIIDSPFSNGFKISEINRNFSLIYRVNEMTEQGVDADDSYLRGSQRENFVGLGGSEMYNPLSSGVQNIDNQDYAAQFVWPENTDGSFLSLGIGDQTDAEFKFDLSRRDIRGELEGHVYHQLNDSHVRKATGDSWNLSQKFPSFQNYVAGFGSLGNDVGGWSSTNHNGGAMRDTNTGLISRPFRLLQIPQAGLQHGFPKPSNRNLGFVDNRDSQYVNLDSSNATFVGGVPTSSGPFSSSSDSLLHSGQSGASGFPYESVNFTRDFTEPTSDQLKKLFMERLQNFSPASSMASSFVGVKGCSIQQEYSGRLFSTTDGNAPVAAASGFYPKRLVIEVNGNGATQADGDGLFPQMTAIQFSNGFQEGMPRQVSKDLLGPTSTAGLVISTAKVYGCSQSSNAVGGPYRRGTIRAPPASPHVQRKKIAHQSLIRPTLRYPVQNKKIALQSPILPSSSSPSQTALAAAVPRHSHIKWQGSKGGLPELIVHKCMLCKRDLSFTAEGEVYQPTIPPTVAVLTCGHTFHDHCLQLITPENQSKDPPCIPCAMDEEA